MLCYILHYVLLILFVNFCNSAKRRDESFIWNKPFWIELNWIELNILLKTSLHNRSIYQLLQLNLLSPV